MKIESKKNIDDINMNKYANANEKASPAHVHHHEHEEAGHVHSHEQTKAVLNRLSRALGHLESVKRMVEDGRDCSEVLIQLAAVQSALNNTGKIILKDHISHCIVDAVKSGDQEELDELYKAIDSFMK
jgi:DNA-binding FrmR family transcriptional regulator